MLYEVTREELERANLLYLVHGQTRQVWEPIKQVYIWHITDHQATICMLANIGRIITDDLAYKSVDNK